VPKTADFAPALRERLREEFHDIQRQTLSEIRQEDE
jgi:hypothetical protein